MWGDLVPPAPCAVQRLDQPGGEGTVDGKVRTMVL